VVVQSLLSASEIIIIMEDEQGAQEKNPVLRLVIMAIHGDGSPRHFQTIYLLLHIRFASGLSKTFGQVMQKESFDEHIYR
jgi:hypothetical protein